MSTHRARTEHVQHATEHDYGLGGVWAQAAHRGATGGLCGKYQPVGMETRLFGQKPNPHPRATPAHCNTEGT